jgi:hypothetical protein
LQQVCSPKGEGLAFIQGKDAMPRIPKKETASKDEIECWHCNKLGHYKNKCPELQQVLDVGIQNINIDECDKEHALFSAEDGYGLIQKQEKGVRGILSPYHCTLIRLQATLALPTPTFLWT